MHITRNPRHSTESPSDYEELTAARKALLARKALSFVDPAASYLQGKIPNSEIRKILKLSKYVGNFLLLTTQFLFAAQSHSKGVALTPENPVIFRFCVITREL